MTTMHLSDIRVTPPSAKVCVGIILKAIFVAMLVGYCFFLLHGIFAGGFISYV